MTVFTKLFNIVTLFLCLFSFWACEDHAIEIPQKLDTQLFQGTEVFDISALFNNEALSFQISDGNNCEYAFIGVFSEPPKVDGNMLVNTDAILWQWQDDISNKQNILLSDGSYSPGQSAIDLDFLQCQSTLLYWAAWGWDKTASLITHSTTSNVFDISLPLPDLSLDEIIILGDAPGDTLLIPGKSINIQLRFSNNGEAPVNLATLILSSPQIPDLESVQPIPSLQPGESNDLLVSITVPRQLSYGDILNLTHTLTYNDCFEETISTPLFINAAKACLTDIRLIHIEYVPPSILWDPFDILPILYDPDVYYLVFNPQNQEIHRSNVINNATDDWPNTPILADWIDISPCIELELDSAYTVAFWDEDSLDADDFIGSTQFRASDYLSTQEEIVTIVNDEVRLELHFSWE